MENGVAQDRVRLAFATVIKHWQNVYEDFIVQERGLYAHRHRGDYFRML